jgi:hypothetical protein
VFGHIRPSRELVTGQTTAVSLSSPAAEDATLPPMTQTRAAAPVFEPDPTIEAYKRDIDRSLIRERLKRTPAERVEDLVALAQFADELRAAGARLSR